MKKTLVGVSAFLFVTSLFLLTVVVSNSAIPGDALYALDRKEEQVALYISKKAGKASYVRTNMELAQERLGEIKVLTLVQKNQALSLVQKAYAAGESNEELNKLISQLFEDINFNLGEVKAVTQEVDDVELSKDIAQQTSEISDDLVTILPKVDESLIDDLAKVTNNIDDIDEQAVEDLVDETDSEKNNEDQSSKEDRALSIEKITKKIMKATEKIGDFEQKIEEKKSKLNIQGITVLEAKLASAKSALEQAKTSLANGEFANAYKYAKDAINLSEDGKDEADNSAEDSNNDSGDDTNDDSNDDSSKDVKKDTKKNTSTKDTKSEDKSGSDKASEDSGKDSSDEEDNSDDSNSGSDGEDNNDGEDDVKGVNSDKSDLLMDMIF